MLFWDFDHTATHITLHIHHYHPIPNPILTDSTAEEIQAIITTQSLLNNQLSPDHNYLNTYQQPHKKTAIYHHIPIVPNNKSIMSRFGVNILNNLPPAKIRNHSTLIRGMEWPKDKEWISELHGPNWTFYLVAWIRKHIIDNATKLFPFTARDSNQALPYLRDLTVLFNPISLLSLYQECLEYYKDCVIGELLEFNEQYYLSIVRSYFTFEDFEADDWFWRFALRQVIWIPRKGIDQLLQKLPDWVPLRGTASSSGCPESLLLSRFPELTSRVQGVYQVITSDLKHAKAPQVNSEGAWGAIAEPSSPFLQAVNNIDHFLLSLYPKEKEKVSFQYSMALDILQQIWTDVDWKYNIFATKFYNTLCSHTNVKSFNTTAVNKQAAAVQAGNVRTTAPDPTNPQNDLNYEPAPFHDLRIKIQMLAADMAFDYCSDHELQLLVSDLDTLVRNPNFPRQGRSSYYAVLKHLKSKIQLYNMIQTETGSNDQVISGDGSEDFDQSVIVNHEYR